MATPEPTRPDRRFVSARVKDDRLLSNLFFQGHFFLPMAIYIVGIATAVSLRFRNSI